MIGILTFSRGIFCKKEVLGKSYPGKIGALDVHIIFPILNEADDKEALGKIGLSNQLQSPVKDQIYLQGDVKLNWGCPMNFPEYDSIVSRVLIECGDADDNSQVLYNNICKWEEAFYNYYHLCTKQYGKKKEEKDIFNSKLALFVNGKYIEDCRPRVLTGKFYSHECFASETIIKEAIEYASSGKELLLEYEMLLSAYKDQETNRNRQAIIDGSSAVELCLVKVIKKYCVEKSIDPQILLSKYRSLGDRFKLVTKIDETLPKRDYQKTIVAPRNNVAHTNEVKPSDETVGHFINSVEEVMKHYHVSYY